MSRLAAHFLCMDESDPNVDYNAEDYSSKPVSYYLTEVVKFAAGVKYLNDNLTEGLSEEQIQTIVYDAARKYDEKDIRGFFKRLYQFLFSTSDGPRLPAFIAILTVNRFLDLLEDKMLERM